MIDLLFGNLLFAASWEMFEVVTVFVFIANFITMCLPNKSKNRYVQWLLDLLNGVAMNIFQNANRMYPGRYRNPAKSSKKGGRPKKSVAGSGP